MYTNNWIENSNRQIRRITKIRNSFPNPKSAEKLVILKCIEIENNYMKYPVTVLKPVQNQLDKLLKKMDLSESQTHIVLDTTERNVYYKTGQQD